MSDQPPPCHRCGQPWAEHDHDDPDSCFYMLPGSTTAAFYDLGEAIRELGRAAIPDFLRRRS